MRSSIAIACALFWLVACGPSTPTEEVRQTQQAINPPKTASVVAMQVYRTAANRNWIDPAHYPGSVFGGLASEINRMSHGIVTVSGPNYRQTLVSSQPACTGDLQKDPAALLAFTCSWYTITHSQADRTLLANADVVWMQPQYPTNDFPACNVALRFTAKVSDSAMSVVAHNCGLVKPTATIIFDVLGDGAPDHSSQPPINEDLTWGLTHEFLHGGGPTSTKGWSHDGTITGCSPQNLVNLTNCLGDTVEANGQRMFLQEQENAAWPKMENFVSVFDETAFYKAVTGWWADGVTMYDWTTGSSPPLTLTASDQPAGFCGIEPCSSMSIRVPRGHPFAGVGQRYIFFEYRHDQWIGGCPANCMTVNVPGVYAWLYDNSHLLRISAASRRDRKQFCALSLIPPTGLA